MTVENHNLGKGRGQVERVEVMTGLGQGRAVEEVRLAGLKLGQVTLVRGQESRDGVAVRLGRVEGRDEMVTEGDHGSAVACLGMNGGADCIVEVGRAVSGQGRVGPHGACGNEGLGAVQGEVDAEDRVSEGVGAVDHDGADNVRVAAAEALVGIHGDVEEAVRVSVGASTAVSAADEVHDCELRDVQDFADVADESLRGKSSRATAVVCGVQTAICRAGQDGSITGVVEPGSGVSARR